MTATVETGPALQLTGVSKAYGTVQACDGIDLTLTRGEIHGVLGENGAGKSTLMKILLGLVRRDAGVILRNGRPVEIADPQEAAALGIGMVHQHYSVIDPLTVWENVVLGDRGRVDAKLAAAQVREVGERYGLPIDPYATVASLSAGERQRVEIIKCLRRDPSVLILDEPTSVLSQAESRDLFSVLRRVVQSEDRAVVLISHKIAEILDATDEVTVLRRGRVVHTARTADTNAAELARNIVGRDVSVVSEGAALGLAPVEVDPAEVAAAEERAAARPVVLSVESVTVRERGVPRLDRLSLEVRAGEILGLYGVEGNGQAVLGDLLSGLLVQDAGTVRVADTEVEAKRPGAFTQAGLGIIPEDRHRSGVVLDMSVAENLVMKSLETAGNGAVVNRTRMLRHAERLAKEFNVISPSLDAPLRNLSGGNQQRVVLAREMSAAPRVLVAAQPTHGLDVGAIEDMYNRLRDAAEKGIGVLLISTELEEVMALSHRIAVISAGHVTGVLAPHEATSERLGLLLGGAAA